MALPKATKHLLDFTARKIQKMKKNFSLALCKLSRSSNGKNELDSLPNTVLLSEGGNVCITETCIISET